jgi:hypothetical protein
MSPLRVPIGKSARKVPYYIIIIRCGAVVGDARARARARVSASSTTAADLPIAAASFAMQVSAT